MRSNVISVLDSNQDYWTFLKERPYWIRILSIEPEKITEFINEYKVVRKKRTIDKIDDINAIINLAETFLKK